MTTAAGAPLRPTILAIRSAPPPFRLTQQQFYEGLARRWYRGLADAESLIAQTRVRQRYMFWDPRTALAVEPAIGERMRAFEKVVVEVAHRATAAAIESHDPNEIGSFVTATNTGYFAPMLDYEIMRRVGLRTSLRRTVIGSMGCFAAFNCFKVALDSLAARPTEAVLINCTEASSLHLRSEATKEQAIVNLLFGDGCASMLMAMRPEGEGPQFIRTHTEQLFATAEMMTLRITDQGFRMTLSPLVPFVLAENIHAFLGQLLGPVGLSVADIRHWGIHPGGPKIVELLAACLGLLPRQTRASWFVLEEHGNCAAVTTLLVLEEILRKDQPARGDLGVLLSFGPGLTMEGALLRF
jgi:predicted naringenin-chalcone synthase